MIELSNIIELFSVTTLLNSAASYFFMLHRQLSAMVKPGISEPENTGNFLKTNFDTFFLIGSTFFCSVDKTYEKTPVFIC